MARRTASASPPSAVSFGAPPVEVALIVIARGRSGSSNCQRRSVGEAPFAGHGPRLHHRRRRLCAFATAPAAVGRTGSRLAAPRVWDFSSVGSDRVGAGLGGTQW